MDNLELKKMFDEDRAVRKQKEVDWKKEYKDGNARLARVTEMLAKNQVKTAADYYHAAMIFQHGETVDEYKKANELAEISMSLGDIRAPWLFAASLDRVLLYTGEKFQKYGTQYKRSKDNVYSRSPIDPKTTDKERARYNVPSLADLQKIIDDLNSSN